jgi:hypothetical protein
VLFRKYSLGKQLKEDGGGRGDDTHGKEKELAGDKYEMDIKEPG